MNNPFNELAAYYVQLRNAFYKAFYQLSENIELSQ